MNERFSSTPPYNIQHFGNNAGSEIRIYILQLRQIEKMLEIGIEYIHFTTHSMLKTLLAVRFKSESFNSLHDKNNFRRVIRVQVYTNQSNNDHWLVDHDL